MVYISGEEMTRYTMQLILDQWLKPHMDTSSWEFFDLSCKARDDTEDKVLHDAVAAGKRLGSIFKEPTVTPTAIQVKELGLKKGWGSPNGAMRRGWKGVSISRDTIHIDGVKLGFDKPVLFDRHAVGGEYGEPALACPEPLHCASPHNTVPSLLLCCAVLCCAVLCYAMLCCAVLCCAVLCCAVLCCAVLCCVVLCCVLLCSVAFSCVVLFCLV